MSAPNVAPKRADQLAEGDRFRDEGEPVYVVGVFPYQLHAGTWVLVVYRHESDGYPWVMHRRAAALVDVENDGDRGVTAQVGADTLGVPLGRAATTGGPQ